MLYITLALILAAAAAVSYYTWTDLRPTKLDLTKKSDAPAGVPTENKSDVEFVPQEALAEIQEKVSLEVKKPKAKKKYGGKITSKAKKKS